MVHHFSNHKRPRTESATPSYNAVESPLPVVTELEGAKFRRYTEADRLIFVQAARNLAILLPAVSNFLQNLSETSVDPSFFPNYDLLPGLNNTLSLDLLPGNTLDNSTEPGSYIHNFDVQNQYSQAQGYGNIFTGFEDISLFPEISLSNPSMESQYTDPSAPLYHRNVVNSNVKLSFAYQKGQAPVSQQCKASLSTNSVNSFCSNGKRETSKCKSRYSDDTKRKEVAATRLRGACVRCRKQKIKCVLDPLNPKGPCSTCQQVETGLAPRVLCVQVKISRVSLIEKGDRPRGIWTQRWPTMKIIEIDNWASQTIKEIQIIQHGNALFYPLKVRKFKPMANQEVERSWFTNGKRMSYKCAPYAIANMKETGPVLRDFVRRSAISLIDHYIDDPKSDELLRETYKMAKSLSQSVDQHQENHLFLREVLELFGALRMESSSEFIDGPETLGMEPQVVDRTKPTYGKTLVAPIISAQIQMIMAEYVLTPLRESVLSKLEHYTTGSGAKEKDFLAVYLSLFILMHNYALLTAHEKRRAEKQGSESPYLEIESVKKLHQSAETLLRYFHYFKKGNNSFAPGFWDSEKNRLQAKLDERQLEFLCKTSEWIQERRGRFQSIRERKEVGNDFFFISQLYTIDWEPIPTIT